MIIFYILASESIRFRNNKKNKNIVPDHVTEGRHSETCRSTGALLKGLYSMYIAISTVVRWNYYLQMTWDNKVGFHYLLL